MAFLLTRRWNVNFAAKLLLTYMGTLFGLFLLFGTLHSTNYDFTTVTWWMRRPIGVLAFVPVAYLLIKRGKEYARSRSN